MTLFRTASLLHTWVSAYNVILDLYALIAKSRGLDERTQAFLHEVELPVCTGQSHVSSMLISTH